mgnify:FL=1
MRERLTEALVGLIAAAIAAGCFALGEINAESRAAGDCNADRVLHYQDRAYDCILRGTKREGA